MISQQNVTIKSGSTWHKICPFPIGFIYLSQKSTSPATTFGGTWAALNEDRFLRPSDAWTTGGSKKISIDQMPAHTHQFNLSVHASRFGGNSPTCSNISANYNSTWPEVTGGGKDYWPPYRDCYGWYRTA